MEYTTEYRQYDPRLGRWMSLDPLMARYPWQSPYVGMDDKPVVLVDPSGLGTEDWVQDASGRVYWDKNANSQETTKEGETYLGKTLTFIFNSFIDAKLWDGPGGSVPAGDKLTSTITVTGDENEEGELTGLTVKKSVKIGTTPVGVARDHFPGLDSDQNKFDLTIFQNTNGLMVAAKINFEQHASVPLIEQFGLCILGYDIVNVAQNLQLELSGNQLSIGASTDIFPSATLTMNGTPLMYYPQPSFNQTHGYRETRILEDNGTGGTVRYEYTQLRPEPAFYTRYRN